jgi:hypothetical protein
MQSCLNDFVFQADGLVESRDILLHYPHDYYISKLKEIMLLTMHQSMTILTSIDQLCALETITDRRFCRLG